MDLKEAVFHRSVEVADEQAHPCAFPARRQAEVRLDVQVFHDTLFGDLTKYRIQVAVDQP